MKLGIYNVALLILSVSTLDEQISSHTESKRLGSLKQRRRRKVSQYLGKSCSTSPEFIGGLQRDVATLHPHVGSARPRLNLNHNFFCRVFCYDERLESWLYNLSEMYSLSIF